MARKFIPIPISNLDNTNIKYCCSYTFKRGINIGKYCLSGIYKDGVCKKHYYYIEKENIKSCKKRCIYNTINGNCNRFCKLDNNYCKYHKNSNKYKVNIKQIYDKKYTKKNKKKIYLDIDNSTNIKNIVIKEKLVHDSVNTMQMILYEPNVFLNVLNNIFEHKRNKKKKYKERKKINKQVIKGDCANNTNIISIKKEFIYTGICLGIKTFEYIQSPFRKCIIVNNMEFKCLRWKLNRIKIEVTMIIECIKTCKKYKHTIKESYFKKLLLEEFSENIVDHYLYD